MEKDLEARASWRVNFFVLQRRSVRTIGRQIVEPRGRILLTRSEQSRKKLPKRNIG